MRRDHQAQFRNWPFSKFNNPIVRSFRWEFLCTVLFLVALGKSCSGEELVLNLNDRRQASDWKFLDNTAELKDGELLLDGRTKISRAVYLPKEWGEVTVSASFLVDEQPDGVLACGFMIRAQDERTYYYVHFDRAQAILVRSSPDNGWIEIARKSQLDKPAGKWHQGKIRCQNSNIEVYLNDQLLYEAHDPTLDRGRIGFYASQGRAHVKDIRVEGNSRDPLADFRARTPSFRYVCEDAKSGGYEAFPDVCRIGEGRLMCVFYAGYSHVSLPNDALPNGGRVSYCVSDDDGRTWSEAKTLVDGPDDDRDPSIVKLRDGRLLCSYFSLRKVEGKSPPYVGLGSYVVESKDDGETWSVPRPIHADYYCSSPIRELPDGRLMLGLYFATDDDASGAVTISDDGGQTWQAPIVIDNGPYRLDAETDVISLSDGSLLAALRGDGNTPLCWSTSTNGGASWSVAQSSGFLGHCPYLHRTTNNLIVLAHRLPNTSLHWSADEGKTWSENVQIDDVGGAYPSMVNLTDGSTLVVYYEEGDGSSIRFKRFRVDKSGVTWLIEPRDSN